MKKSILLILSGLLFTAYSILSTQGRVIDGGPLAKQQFDINTSGLSHGVYILLLKGNNQNVSMKFVK